MMEETAMRRMRIVLAAGLLVLCATPAFGQRKLREPGTMAFMINTVSPGVVLLSWPPVQKAVAYELERCEGSGLTTCTMKTHPRITSGQPLQVQDTLTVSGTYLYRITAFASNQLPIAQNQVAYQYTAPLTAVLMPAPTGTITPIPAGPSQLTAVSTVPGSIHLSWSPVPNAIGFHVIRSNSGGETNHESGPTGLDAYGNILTAMTDGPIDFRWTYSYQVYARFKSATGETQSAPSPTASAKSIPFVQVSGLTYTMVPSTRSPGYLNITVRWNAVPDVLRYDVWDETMALLASSTSTAYLAEEVPTHRTITVCVGAVYPWNVAQNKTAPCIQITT
jgi:hypothetical protein